MDQKSEFGAALRQVREKKGIPQERLGSSQSFISTIERGIRSPTLQKMEEFAAVLGISPVTLLAYANLETGDNCDHLLARVKKELKDLGC